MLIIPQTLLEAITHYADLANCIDLISHVHWHGKPVCPQCKSTNICTLTTRVVWRCRDCRKQFSAKVGTVMEDSPIPLTKWLPTVWMIVNSKVGISSREIARSIAITQRSAWFMLHRIRKALTPPLVDKLSGEIEIDETLIGGKAKNKHRRKKPFGRRMGPQEAKTLVIGMLQRRGEVRAAVIADLRKDTTVNEVLTNVEQDSIVYTDGRTSHKWLDILYHHNVIQHCESYVRGKVHINTIENFWSQFKRTIHGSYYQLGPKHLHRYLDEQAFRYNHKNTNDGGRFLIAMSQIFGKRLTWRDLVGK